MIEINLPSKNELISYRNYSCLPEDGGIYLLENKLGEVIYVGTSKNLKSRINNHKYRKITYNCRILLNSNKSEQFMIETIYKYKYLNKLKILTGSNLKHLTSPTIKEKNFIYITEHTYFERRRKIKNLRDIIIFDILYYTGIKVTELININKENINLEENLICLKKREIKIHPILKESLIKYFDTYNLKNKIISLTRGRIHQITQDYNFPTINAFRHTYALNYLFRNKQDYIGLCEELGYSSPVFCYIYRNCKYTSI